MPGALSHIRVVDMTSNLSGPYCAMILGDQGADVIKVERKGEGDVLRKTPPFVNGESAPFMLWTRNKRGIELDMFWRSGGNIAIPILGNAGSVREWIFLVPVSLYAIVGILWAFLNEMGYDTMAVWNQIVALFPA